MTNTKHIPQTFTAYYVENKLKNFLVRLPGKLTFPRIQVDVNLFLNPIRKPTTFPQLLQLGIL